jgi:hypothetical protein
MNVNLTTDEAQALLDGINVVIHERAKDVAFFKEAGTPGPELDKVLSDLRRDLDVAKSARKQIQKVA